MAAVPVEIVPYSEEWPAQFALVENELSLALQRVAVLSIEHVGSTSVPGIAAKPIIDIDIVVERQHVVAAISALAEAGYVHCGDLGLTDREAFAAPDENPARNVYVCVEGTLHLRNHLAVRRVLRRNSKLRERYGAVKLELSRDSNMNIATYTAEKSEVLQDVLASSDLSDEEKALILALNTRP